MSFFHPTCPRCHEGRLFSGLLRISPRCASCGLPLEQHGAGDGPAYFTILIYGIVVTIVAGIVEYKLAPPLWVHAMLWVPLIFLGSILCLRLFKSLLIDLEYRQGRLRHPEDS
jgi:uncharacterized protein (DUF983 family)